MSIISEKFQNLKQWETYKSINHFKQYTMQNRLSEEEKRTLISAFQELEKLNNHTDILTDASIIDRALEIKKRYELSPKEPTSNQNQNNTKRAIDDNKNQEFETLEFRGSTMEYFKIWIVNMFLTIVTLGIYSAWAKVRTNRYFYANTYYQNASFEYTANPISILKGRLIILAIYVLFIISSQVFLNPIMTLSIFAFALVITPWIINRAIKFKLKNIKHRNINFQYDENAPLFYKFFFIHMIINILTVGLAYPYSLNEFKKLLIKNSRFGNTTFKYEGKTGEMYKQYLKVIGAYLGYILIPFFLLGVAASVILPHLMPTDMKSMAPDSTEFQMFILGITVLTYLSYIIVIPAVKGFYDAYIANYVWEKTELKENRFESTLKPTKLAWIYVSNIFAIIFSLGFLTPWAKVRLTNYKCKNFAIASTNMSSFIAEKQSNQSAIGEEAEDFFDIDIGV